MHKATKQHHPVDNNKLATLAPHRDEMRSESTARHDGGNVISLVRGSIPNGNHTTSPNGHRETRKRKHPSHEHFQSIFGDVYQRYDANFNPSKCACCDEPTEDVCRRSSMTTLAGLLYTSPDETQVRIGEDMHVPMSRPQQEDIAINSTKRHRASLPKIGSIPLALNQQACSRCGYLSVKDSKSTNDSPATRPDGQFL